MRYHIYITQLSDINIKATAYDSSILIKQFNNICRFRATAFTNDLN